MSSIFSLLDIEGEVALNGSIADFPVLAEVPVPPSQDSFKEEPDPLDVPDEPLSELALVPAPPIADMDKVLRGDDGVVGVVGISGPRKGGPSSCPSNPPPLGSLEDP
jgi:hypothetical protein